MTKEDFSNIQGRVWKFGDKISTDFMMPGYSTGKGLERAKFCMRSNRPGWSDLVKPGDLIVGGINYGCGSSRQAAVNLMALGIKCVIAESMGRIFFRNSIALGFPVIIAPGITSLCEEGDILQINLPKGVIKNLKTSKTLKFDPIAKDSPPMQILEAGGIMKLLEQELGKK